MQSVVVLEANEIPLKVFQEFQSLKPASSISKILDQSIVLETIADDVPVSVLYPSQTWASMNTGVGYDLHEIHWYNDPKPEAYPLYWKFLANHGISVGLVNTLHSSPASDYFEKSDSYKFVLPDCFAVDNFAYPSYLQNFQAINLKSTSLNSRISTMRLPVKEIALSIPNISKYGIQKKTVVDTCTTISKIVSKQIGKERLRNLQFPAVADIFLKHLEEYKPQLSVLFTNHVAANMHRYWYGLFPSDWDYAVYDKSWVAKYSEEVMSAMELLDFYLGKLIDFVTQNDAILVISTSMGQCADLSLPEGVQETRKYDFRLEKVESIVSALTQTKFTYNIEAGMIPQYSLEFENDSVAEKFAAEVKDAIPTIKGFRIRPDHNDNVVTLSIWMDSSAEFYSIRGKKYSYSDLGFTRFKIDDHRSGKHSPQGSLMIFNSKTAFKNSSSINYLEYAPAILKHFAVGIPDYMLQPTFSF